MTQHATTTFFARYVRLYTLHAVERPSQALILRVRIETLRYSFAPLARLPLDTAYAEDPRAATELVRAAVVPRLQTLLDARDPFCALQLAEGDAIWRRYAAQRGLPSEPVRVPIVQPPPRVPLPVRPTADRLAQVERALGLLQTAAETAAALAGLWQNWQLARGKRDLLDLQRALLQDAIHAQLAGQTAALDRAQHRDFVHGYLASHADDAAYGAVFDQPPDN